MRETSVVRVANTENEREEVPLSKNLINSYSVNLILSGILPPITFWHADLHSILYQQLPCVHTIRITLIGWAFWKLQPGLTWAYTDKRNEKEKNPQVKLDVSVTDKKRHTVLSTLPELWQFCFPSLSATL